MKNLNQRGHLNALLIPLILLVLVLFGAIGFGVWAYMGRQDYKDNTDQKVAAAVTVAEEKTSTKKDNEFIEKEKLPLRTYNGPAAFASLVVMYPKTWSAYVSEKASGPTPIDAFFHPKTVPSSDGSPSYALRVQIVSSSYASVIKNFEPLISSGKTKATAYIPAKVPSVTGLRLDGNLPGDKQGAMVVVPVRDKTLKIWTESNDYLKDFNENILPNYSFSQ